MVKFFFPDQLLAKWFIKSLLPSITEDVAKGGFVTKEQAISRAQYLKLIYTQSGMLYDKIPNAPRPAFTIPPPPSSKDSHVDDSVIRSSSTQMASSHLVKHLLFQIKPLIHLIIHLLLK